MGAYTTSTRWWENYLVRYFMPSVAGVLAVIWLADIAGGAFQDLLLIPRSGEPLKSANLLLLILYGNLFCYIASYPILVFHATRILDFKGPEVRWQWLPYRDGYMITTVLALLALLATVLPNAVCRVWLAGTLVLVFSALQLARLYVALHPRQRVYGLHSQASPMMALAYSLARRRGVRQVTEAATREADTRASGPGAVPGSEANHHEDAQADLSEERVIEWRAELIDTYRHMREHGNSSFIFLLELVLAAVAFCILTVPGAQPTEQLSRLAVLAAVWAFPAMFVHMAGQHIERYFSQLNGRRRA